MLWGQDGKFKGTKARVERKYTKTEVNWLNVKLKGGEGT